MTDAGFALDPRLRDDTHPVVALPLCELLLMDDARFPWLILVPRRVGMRELLDLDAVEQASLWSETRLASRALRAVASHDKLNLGALGNVVRQLHVHVVGRREGDAAWPGPVWGHGRAERYEAHERVQLIAALRAAINDLPNDP